MKRFIFFLSLLIGTLFVVGRTSPFEEADIPSSSPVPVVDAGNLQLFAFHSPDSPVVSAKDISIRLLCVRHCREQMATTDANMVVQAAQRAQQKGLDIRVVGNVVADNLQQFQQYVKEYIKKDAKPGDTFMIFTVGHGSPNGNLMALGQRMGPFNAIAKEAGEQKQETLWWQLSCHAAANLPGINTLPDDKQKLFSIMNSSPAERESPAYVEGKLIEKMFMAIADKSRELDANGDGVITAGELRNWMAKAINRPGSLLLARNADEPIFGKGPGLNFMIIDRVGPQGTYPEDYVPLP